MQKTSASTTNPKLNMKLKIAILEDSRTQEQIASMAGLCPSAMSRIVRGYLNPTKEVAFKLAQVLGSTTRRLDLRTS